MAKVNDYELWRTRYPSAGVSWNEHGDPAVCGQFIGAAKVMLYNLKNRIRLSGMADPAYAIKTLQDIQRFNDGTVITVRSIYGMDFVEIEGGLGSPSCSITFFNLPDTVPPMDGSYETLLAKGDVDLLYRRNDDWSQGALMEEGYEYIKTYYVYGKVNCPECAENWLICKTDKLNLDRVLIGFSELEEALGYTGALLCKPFIFEDDGKSKWGTLPTSIDGFRMFTQDVAIANYHCVWSLWAHCQAEIVQVGADNDGSYVMWRAYTEWSNVGREVVSFSKTGLGYLLFGLISDPELCKSKNVIKVDCCEKRIEGRRMIMNWEQCTGQLNQDFCAVPDTAAPWYYFFTTLFGEIYLMAYPDRDQNCPPYEWELLGFGEISVDDNDPLNQYCLYTYDYDEVDCNVQMKITVRDRCGEEDTLIMGPCCGTEDPLVIEYATLAMQCTDVQNLTVSGGCGPYTWELSGGGGTLTPDSTGGSGATYEAPDTNANCTENPTITVTDCCGNTTNIGIAINCNTSNDEAYVTWSYVTTYYSANCGFQCAYGNGPFYEHRAGGSVYKCDGSVARNCTSYAVIVTTDSSSPPAGSNPTVCGFGCTGDPNATVTIYTITEVGWRGIAQPSSAGANCGCTDPGSQGCGSCYKNAVPNGCVPPGSGITGTAIPGHNTAWDLRTAAMIAAGCCPLNPYTGLPF